MRNLLINKSLIKNTRVIIIALRKYSIKIKLIRDSKFTIFDILRINFKFKLRYISYIIIRR